jgi:hypothetical protein
MSEADSVAEGGPEKPTGEAIPEVGEGIEWKTPGEAGPNERRMWWGLLLLLVLIAYVPGIRGGFIWDDDRHIIDNKDLRDVPGLVRAWTRGSAAETRHNPRTYTRQRTCR